MSYHQAETFLDLVWFTQNREGYATTSAKVEGEWSHKFVHFTHEEEASLKELWLNDGQDLYFCPNLFRSAHRQEAEALPSRWLYADLDEVHPEGIDITPTLWWETSPGRFQALWWLKQSLAVPDLFKKVNQRLTYYLGADKGGWGLSKLLRVPGSVSTKHGEFHIECDEDLSSADAIDVRDIWAKIKHVPASPVTLSGRVDMKATMEASKVLKRLPPKLRKRVATQSIPEGKRSGYMHGIVAALLEEGVKPGDVLAVMKTNKPTCEKYGGRIDQEVGRSISKLIAPDKASAPKRTPKLNGHQLKAENLTSFMAKTITIPKYLVDGFWSTEAHGMIVGGHKTFKSLIVQDLLVSVATGTKFLNAFDVPQSGHVIYIQQENPEAFIQDRFSKILISRGLGGSFDGNGRVTLPASAPITIVSNKGFRLTEEDHLEWLEALIEANKTKLVVLDPLYLMMPGVDENSAAGMTPILQRLLEIKQDHNVGIVLVHHYKKQDRNSPMLAEDDRISGTSTFGRFYESLILVEKGDEPHSVKLYPKHRLHPPGGVINVEFEMGPIGDTFYEPIVSVPRDEQADLYKTMDELIIATPGITVAQLARELGMKTERVKRMISRSHRYKLKDVRGGSPKLIRTSR